MSETVPETSSPSSSPLRSKLGPLPTWGWLLIVTGLFAAYYLYEKHKSSSASSSAGTSTTMSGAAGIPDYVSQTTVNVTEPPDQPPVTVAPPPKEPGPYPPPITNTPGPKPPARKPGKTGGGTQPPLMSGSYTVKAGDTLDKIAARYHISRVDLAHANGLGTGAGLKTGTVLKVPGPLKTRAEGGPG